MTVLFILLVNVGNNVKAYGPFHDVRNCMEVQQEYKQRDYQASCLPLN